MFGKGKSSMSSAGRFIMAQGRKVGNLKGRGTAPKTAPTVEVKKGAAAIKPITPAPSLAQRTINRSSVRFATSKKAGEAGPVQGGRKA